MFPVPQTFESHLYPRPSLVDDKVRIAHQFFDGRLIHLVIAKRKIVSERPKFHQGVSRIVAEVGELGYLVAKILNADTLLLRHQIADGKWATVSASTVTDRAEQILDAAAA